MPYALGPAIDDGYYLPSSGALWLPQNADTGATDTSSSSSLTGDEGHYVLEKNGWDATPASRKVGETVQNYDIEGVLGALLNAQGL